MQNSGLLATQGHSFLFLPLTNHSKVTGVDWQSLPVIQKSREGTASANYHWHRVALIAVTKPDQKALREERVTVACSLRVTVHRVGKGIVTGVTDWSYCVQ